MWPNPKEIADLVTFTEEILHFLCSEDTWNILRHAILDTLADEENVSIIVDLHLVSHSDNVYQHQVIVACNTKAGKKGWDIEITLLNSATFPGNPALKLHKKGVRKVKKFLNVKNSKFSPQQQPW